MMLPMETSDSGSAGDRFIKEMKIVGCSKFAQKLGLPELGDGSLGSMLAAGRFSVFLREGLT